MDFYSKTNSKYDLIIKNKQGITLNKISGELDQGFSQISYDLSINKIGQESYNRKNKTKKLQKSESGIFYLPKGEYNFILNAPVGSYSQKLIIK